MKQSRVLKYVLSVLVAVAAVSLVGCDDDDDDDGGTVHASVTGSWTITQTFSTASIINITMTITETSGVISGNSSYGAVAGTRTGNTIAFTIQDEDLKTFNGSVLDDSSMGGTFTENFEDTLFRNGSWTATRTP